MKSLSPCIDHQKYLNNNNNNNKMSCHSEIVFQRALRWDRAAAASAAATTASRAADTTTGNDGDGELVPFCHLFSALWHWSPAVAAARAAQVAANANAEPSAEPNADLGVDFRVYGFHQHPSTAWAATRESHRLAVQFAMGCSSQFSPVGRRALSLFVARFGPISGSPPTCVRRAHASLVVPPGGNAAAVASPGGSYMRPRLVPWFHGDVTRTEARRALQEAARKGGATRFLVRCSRSDPASFVLSVASHPAFNKHNSSRASSSGGLMASSSSSNLFDDEEGGGEHLEEDTGHVGLAGPDATAAPREADLRNYKIRCDPKSGFSIDGNAPFPNLIALLADRGMTAPFFRPCPARHWSAVDPEAAVAVAASRLASSTNPEAGLVHAKLRATPCIDSVQLETGIAAFEWDIDEAVMLFEDVYRRNSWLAVEGLRAGTGPSSSGMLCFMRETLSCARALGNLGNAQQKKGKGEVAVRYFDECLQLLRRLMIVRCASDAQAQADARTASVGGGSGNGEGHGAAAAAVAATAGTAVGAVPAIMLADLVEKEANIVANLCVVTSHILQVTPGDVSKDERKAQIAVQLASCLGEELGIAGNQAGQDEAEGGVVAMVPEAVGGGYAADGGGASASPEPLMLRAKMLSRHKQLLASTQVQLDWVAGLAGKLVEDGFQMQVSF